MRQRDVRGGAAIRTDTPASFGAGSSWESCVKLVSTFSKFAEDWSGQVPGAQPSRGWGEEMHGGATCGCHRVRWVSPPQGPAR